MKRHGVFHLFLILGFSAIFLAFPSIPALAQEALTAPQTSEAPAQNRDKMDDVPDEFIEEAIAYYEECESTHQLNNYYDCECLSLAYLDERVKLGPTISGSTIQFNIRKQCRDAIGSAGPTYSECLRKANRFQPGTDPEKYCECVANTYVKNMNRLAPGIGSTSIVNFKTNAYVTCNRQARQR